MANILETECYIKRNNSSCQTCKCPEGFGTEKDGS